MNERDVSAGLLVLGVRAGVAAGRLVVLPVRVLARGPLQPLASRVARTGAEARATARMRARSAAPEVERMVDSALDGPLPDAVMKRMVDRVLASPELDRVVEEVASSQAVRNAVARQTTTFADEVAGRVRQLTTELDDVLERKLHRRAGAATVAYGGIVTRGVAFGLDLALLAVAFLCVTAFVALATSLFGDLDAWLVGALLGVGWEVAAALYFVFFWSAAGQTPGMRVLHQRVAGRTGSPPGVARALIRFLVLTVVALGVLVILFDNKRRALHDLIAGTVVVHSAGPVR